MSFLSYLLLKPTPFPQRKSLLRPLLCLYTHRFNISAKIYLKLQHGYILGIFLCIAFFPSKYVKYFIVLYL